MQKRAEIEARFHKSRNNLLWVVALSGINVILALFDAEISFMFSATFPVFSVGVGSALAGEFGSQAWLAAGAIVALVTIALYGLCYVLSKKYQAFILVALVLFSIDSLFLLGLAMLEFDISAILSVAIHVWVLYYLVMGVRAWFNLKKIPSEEEENHIWGEFPEQEA